MQAACMTQNEGDNIELHNQLERLQQEGALTSTDPDEAQQAKRERY